MTNSKKVTPAVETAIAAETVAPIAAAPIAAPKIRKTKPAQLMANGVAQPREGTVGHKLWALCDEVAATLEGSYKEIRNAIIQKAGDDYNAGNVRTEISVWRKYRGIAK